MTPTPTELALRAAVYANPADTAARLVYADAVAERDELAAAHIRIAAQPGEDTWRMQLADVLEAMPVARVVCMATGKYHGDLCFGGRVQSPNPQFTRECEACQGAGYLPDPTPRLRAELCRVQCRMSEAKKTCRCGSCVKSGQHHNGPCAATRVWTEKDGGVRCHHRERELLTLLRDTLPKCVTCEGRGWLGTGHGDGFYPREVCPTSTGTGRAGTYVRGVVEDVKVPRMADVWERARVKCPECEDGTIGRPKPGRGPGGQWNGKMCDRCDGMGYREEWQPTAWARDLIRDHASVLRVWCEDREPEAWEHDGKLRYSWFLDGFTDDAATAPEPVFDKLVGYDWISDGRKVWWTADAARLALAEAVAEILREACQDDRAI